MARESLAHDGSGEAWQILGPVDEPGEGRDIERLAPERLPGDEIELVAVRLEDLSRHLVGFGQQPLVPLVDLAASPISFSSLASSASRAKYSTASEVIN